MPPFTRPPSFSPSFLVVDHPDTELHELLLHQMKYLFQRPQLLQPVLQKLCESLHGSGEESENDIQRQKEVRALVEQLVIGPTKVGA